MVSISGNGNLSARSNLLVLYAILRFYRYFFAEGSLNSSSLIAHVHYSLSMFANVSSKDVS